MSSLADQGRSERAPLAGRQLRPFGALDLSRDALEVFSV